MKTMQHTTKLPVLSTPTPASTPGPGRVAERARALARRALLLGLLEWCIPLLAPAQFSYEATNGTVTITGYAGTNSEVVIPARVADLPVTRIGDFAFYYQQDITSVFIPSSVTNIGSDAFAYCTGLTQVSLGDNVASLGNWAFNGCSGLTNLTLPEHLASIGHFAIANCTRLTDVLLPASVTNLGAGVLGSCSKLTAIDVAAANPSFSSRAGVLFDQAQATLVQFPAGLGGGYAVPATVTRIADAAFDGARGLTEVVIPEGVAAIGSSAFGNCRGLARATLPGTLTNLGTLAFSYCTNLVVIDLPEGLIQIGDGPFATCYSLTAIRVAPGNPAYRSVDGVLYDRAQTRLIQYPVGRQGAYEVLEGVTHVGFTAFMGARGLTRLALPASLTSLGDWVCANCSSLTAIVIPNQVQALGDWSFHACTSLASLTLGTNVARIGDLAFLRCRSLTNVTIPARTEEIGSMAFYGSESLAGLFFLGPPPSLGPQAFDACPGATAYYFPGSPGWGTNYGSLPARLWNPAVLTRTASFGMQAGHFGFAIEGTAGIPVIIETGADVQSPLWRPVQSGSLTNGQFYFRDPDPSTGGARFYRVRWP